MDKNDSEKWLDTQDVCLMLKISPKTLERYRRDKVLRYSKIRKKTYYRESEVQELLMKNMN